MNSFTSEPSEYGDKHLGSSDLVDLAVIGYPWLMEDHSKIISAASTLGLRAEIWSPDRLGIKTGDDGSFPTLNGVEVEAKILIPRGINSVFPFVKNWLLLMQNKGSLVINSISASENCIDKLLTYLELSQSGVPILPTSSYLLSGYIPYFEGNIVVKPAFGSGGNGVIKYSERETLQRDFLPPLDSAAKLPLYQHHVLQPLASSWGTDYRIVIGSSNLLASTTRKALPGRLITNGQNSVISAGSPTEAIAVAVNASKVLGLDFCGVDVIEHEGKMFVLEVSCWPGLSRTSEACDVDLASKLVQISVDEYVKRRDGV